MALTPTLHLVSAARGASGATAIAGAKRARILPNMAKRVSRSAASPLPERVWMTGAQPRILVETENNAEWLTGITAATAAEKLVLVFATPTGSATLTVDGVRQVDVGEFELPSREGGGTVSVFGILFAVVVSGTKDTLAECMVLS